MSIVVYGDQDFLEFCLPTSVEMHHLILGGKINMSPIFFSRRIKWWRHQKDA